MERFYSEAKDADIIIYNSSIDGQIYEISELLKKVISSPISKQLKAAMIGVKKYRICQSAFIPRKSFQK